MDRYDYWESEERFKKYAHGEWVKHRDVAELIECDEIEQEFEEAGYRLWMGAHGTDKYYVEPVYVVDTQMLHHIHSCGVTFVEESKLEALLKAIEWMRKEIEYANRCE